MSVFSTLATYYIYLLLPIYLLVRYLFVDYTIHTMLLTQSRDSNDVAMATSNNEIEGWFRESTI